MEANQEGKNLLNMFYMHDTNTPSSCGYCKIDNEKKKTSYSLGFVSESVTPEMYEQLMLLGWRRCGDYIYKPYQEKSCCKLFTLRLDIERFRINKNQKRVMKNFRNFIAGKKDKHSQLKTEEDVQMENFEILDKYVNFLKIIIDNFLCSNFFIENFNFKSENLKELNYKVYSNKNSKNGDYSTNFLITLFHCFTKRNETFKSDFPESEKFYIKIFDLFNNHLENNHPTSWKLSLSAKTGHINFFALDTSTKEDIEKIRKYETDQKTNKSNNIKKVLPANPSSLYKLEYFNEFVTEPALGVEEIKHKYTLHIESSLNFSEEKFAVYKKYQIAVHKDKEEDLTPERYVSAWGSTNLKHGKKIENKNNSELIPPKTGTYDLIHRIDGRIFAVGVLDILPTSMSSVYLYYDPEFAFLNPGVFTAVREIEFLRHLNINSSNDYRYYCMGFYCHTCPKMSYKGEYSPSQLLCPVTYNWVDLDKVKPALESNQVQLSSSEKLRDLVITKQEKTNILKSLEFTYNNSVFNVMSFIKKYIRKSSQEQLIENLENFVDCVGKNTILKFDIVG